MTRKLVVFTHLGFWGKILKIVQLSFFLISIYTLTVMDTVGTISGVAGILSPLFSFVFFIGYAIRMKTNRLIRFSALAAAIALLM